MLLRITRFMVLSCALWLSVAQVINAASFIVEDIEVEGLQRIQAGTLFTYLPVKVGDEFDDGNTAEVIRELFKTGFFKDVSLRRRGDVLIVIVEERPAISSLTFDGNKDIPDDELEKVLKSVNISKGRVLNRSVLERLENELLQQYFARGKYNVVVATEIKELPRNRVDIAINISEGDVAKIKRINIVGNEDYVEDKLMKDFESGIPSWYAFLSSKDKYSKQKLSGDLETLRSFYLDKGYLQFNVDSTQVSLSPDKDDIYITVNIDEGDKYTVKDINLAGTFVVPEDTLRKLIQLEPGETFSRSKVVQTTELFNRVLGNKGYSFAKINPIPEIDKDSKEVSLTFFVDPGERIYVRRINFKGNNSTRDEVFRREMRQMEGAWYSLDNVDLSRRRLERLPFVESMDIKTERVPGISDQVDLNIEIVERMAGSFTIGAGYSGDEGFIFNTTLSEENFLGTGKSVSLRFNNSDSSTVYSLSYTNPYYTIDGVSRGFSISYVETDAAESSVSDYNANTFTGNFVYGIPLTEVDRLRFGIGFSDVEIVTSINTPTEILDFIAENDDNYLNFPLTAGFSHDTRNRGLFATRGNQQSLNLEVTVPGSDLEYYKIDYVGKFYFPVASKLTLLLNSRVGYGEGYGETTDLPFFEKYYAGGQRTVRGYENNSLGPLDSSGDPFGGNFRVVANAELIFPPPFVDDPKNIRLSLFADAGTVFRAFDDFDEGEIRTSAGIAMSWISPVGALTFSWAQPLNDTESDEVESFQFNIGTLY